MTKPTTDLTEDRGTNRRPGESQTSPGGPLGMEEEELTRVMIVDESPYLRVGLRSALETESDFEVVGDFPTVADSIARLVELEPPVVLLSLDVRGAAGFKGCLQILEAAPRTRVIIMASELTDGNILASMSFGAAGILPKHVSPCDLVRTVRASGCGEVVLIAPVAECVLRFVRANKGIVDRRLLTEREEQIVVLISKGLGNREIAAQLGLSRHTVRNHINRMFRKLGVSSRAELAAYLPLVGDMANGDAIGHPETDGE